MALSFDQIADGKWATSLLLLKHPRRLALQARGFEEGKAGRLQLAGQRHGPLAEESGRSHKAV
jgi:hypothetical protein